MIPASKLILGTAQFGLAYGINNSSGKITKSDASKILSEAKTSGVTILDTSYAYGDSEEVLGELLDNDYHFKIISKLPQTDDSPLLIFKETTKRLKKNKLYGYLIHHFEYFKEKQSIWANIQALQKEGLIEKAGFSLYSIKELEYLFSKNIAFDIVQVPYNILDQAFGAYLNELKQRNIVVHTRSVFLQGLLLMPVDKLPEQLKPLKPYLVAIYEFCNKENITIEELALNGVIHRQDIDGVLMGVDNIIQLNKNVKSIWNGIPKRISEFINTIDVKNKELLNPTRWNQ